MQKNDRPAWAGRRQPLGLTVVLLVVFAAGPFRPVGALSPTAPVPVEPAVAAAPVGANTIYLPFINNSPAATSAELIDAAVEAGTIDAETGLVYKVLATFGDPRLPAQYRGDDSQSFEADGIHQAAADWASLSPANRTLLAPFFQPPLYQESWWGLQQAGAAGQATVGSTGPAGETPEPIPGDNWTSMTSMGGALRIWWEPTVPGSTQQKAQQVEAVLAETVWPQLTSLMGRSPISDDGPHVFDDLQGNQQIWGDGGDGALDIYLIPCSGCGGALTVGYPPGCQERPSFMIIDPRFNNLEAAVAHEFMHVLQLTYKVADECAEYNWLSEGTANWAIDYVYPTNNFEHRHKTRFSLPNYALNKGNGYDSWPFFVYISRMYGHPEVLAAIWQNTEEHDSLAAINAALPGGWATHWMKSALEHWNSPPVNKFATLDGYEDASSLGQDVAASLGNANFRSYPMDAEMDYLGQAYYRFTFAEAGISTVSLVHPFASGHPTVRVQGLVRMEGQTNWQPVANWSNKGTVTFCRDLVAERIAEMVIIFSDHEWQDRSHRLDPTPEPRVDISNVACAGWDGWVQYTHHSVDENDAEEVPIRSEYNEDFYTSVTLRYTPTHLLAGLIPGAFFYVPDADVVTDVDAFGWAWDELGQTQCLWNANEQLVPIALERSYMLVLPSQAPTYAAIGDMDAVVLDVEDETCGNDGPLEVDQTEWWNTGDGINTEELVISEDGRHITGRHTWFRDDLNWTFWEWEFTALPRE